MNREKRNQWSECKYEKTKEVMLMSTTSELAGLIPVVVAGGIVKKFSGSMLSGKSVGSRSGRKKKGKRMASSLSKKYNPF